VPLRKEPVEMAKSKARKFAIQDLENSEENLAAKHHQQQPLVANINVLEWNVHLELVASNQAVAWDLLASAFLDRRKRLDLVDSNKSQMMFAR